MPPIEHIWQCVQHPEGGCTTLPCRLSNWPCSSANVASACTFSSSRHSQSAPAISTWTGDPCVNLWVHCMKIYRLTACNPTKSQPTLSRSFDAKGWDIMSMLAQQLLVRLNLHLLNKLRLRSLSCLSTTKEVGQGDVLTLAVWSHITHLGAHQTLENFFSWFTKAFLLCKSLWS